MDAGVAGGGHLWEYEILYLFPSCWAEHMASEAIDQSRQPLSRGHCNVGLVGEVRVKLLPLLLFHDEATWP